MKNHFNLPLFLSLIALSVSVISCVKPDKVEAQPAPFTLKIEESSVVVSKPGYTDTTYIVVMANTLKTDTSRIVKIPYTLTGDLGEPEVSVNVKYTSDKDTAGVEAKVIPVNNTSGVIEIIQKQCSSYISEDAVFNIYYASATIEIIVTNGNRELIKNIELASEYWKMWNAQGNEYGFERINSSQAKLNKVVPKEGCQVVVWLGNYYGVNRHYDYVHYSTADDHNNAIDGFKFDGDVTLGSKNEVKAGDVYYKLALQIDSNDSGTEKKGVLNIHKTGEKSNWNIQYTQMAE